MNDDILRPGHRNDDHPFPALVNPKYGDAIFAVLLLIVGFGIGYLVSSYQTAGEPHYNAVRITEIGVSRTGCYEDEVAVWDGETNSHALCVPLDDLLAGTSDW
jgi:hypothetical protein